MRDPYYEVLRTYWRMPFSSWVAVGWTLVALSQFIVTIALPEMSAQHALLPMTMGIWLLGMFLWSRFKEHVASDRRILYPSYVLPHALTFAGVNVLLVIVWPVLVMLHGRTTSLGLMAFEAAFMAGVGWAIVIFSGPVWIALTVVFLCLMSPNIVERLSPWLNGQHETTAIALLIASLLAIVIAIIRLCRLTEENAAYHRRPQFSSWSLRPRMTGEVNRAWSDAQKSGLVGWPKVGSRAFLPANHSVWSGARRWLSLAQNRGWVGFFLGVAFMTVLLGLFSHPVRGTDPLFMLSFALPAALTAGSWLTRWRFMEMELLRPTKRARLLKELGLAILVNQLQTWSMYAAAFVACVFLFGLPPNGMRSASIAIAASFIVQFFGFGLSVFLMKRRSAGWLFLAMLPLSAIGGIFGEMAGINSLGSQLALILSSVFLALLGIAITRSAYKDWLVTELG